MTTVISKLLNEHFSKSLINMTELKGGWSAQAFKMETNDGVFFLKVYDKEKASTLIWTSAIDTYMPIVVCFIITQNLRLELSVLYLQTMVNIDMKMRSLFIYFFHGLKDIL